MQNVNEAKNHSNDAGQVSASRSGTLPTPRPWRIYAYDRWQPVETYPKNIIESPTGESIAEIEGGWPQCTLAENEANAELIVRAVNSHDALVHACKTVKAYLDRLEDDGGYYDPLTEARKRYHAPLQEALIAALKLAEVS